MIDPALDQDFSPIPPAKAPRGRSAAYIMPVAAMVAAVWVGVLFDPHLGPLTRFTLTAAGAALGVFALAIVLCWLGFGLFAVGDRLIAWVKRSSGWPEP